jgi:hypothetical protein
MIGFSLYQVVPFSKEHPTVCYNDITAFRSCKVSHKFDMSWRNLSKRNQINLILFLCIPFTGVLGILLLLSVIKKRKGLARSMNQKMTKLEDFRLEEETLVEYNLERDFLTIRFKTA